MVLFLAHELLALNTTCSACSCVAGTAAAQHEAAGAGQSGLGQRVDSNSPQVGLATLTLLEVPYKN